MKRYKASDYDPRVLELFDRYVHGGLSRRAFLDRAARRTGVPLELGPRLCTLRLSRRLDPERNRSHRLVDLCERYDVPLERAHDALHDATATAAVLPHLLAAHGVTRPDDLEPLLDRSPVHARFTPPGRPRRRRRRRRSHAPASAPSTSSA